jgi:two-component system sensor histidine kinase ChvG
LPDSGTLTGLTASPTTVRRFRQRWVSPLLRRILLVNALPLALLVVALLYLDQYRNGLLEAQIGALREQARVFAGALAESAVRTTDPDNPRLVPEVARSLLRRLTEPTPDAQAKLFAPDGATLADSRIRETVGGQVLIDRLPPPPDYGPVFNWIGRVYDSITELLPNQRPVPTVDGGGQDWQLDVKEEVRLRSANESRETPPYIRRTRDNRLLVTVAVPVERDRKTVGIISLTREAREVDAGLFTVRVSILALFGMALGLTVLLSWYLSLTIARPILRLAGAAAEMREGRGRTGSVPASLLARRDEVGALATALSDSAAALWARMDAIERFAADVAHEIKNPLSSIRSAIETLPRIEDPARQRQLLSIIGQDVVRLDRLISDVSDASRLDAELSRVTAESVDVVPILQALRELDEATRESEQAPTLEVIAPPAGAKVWAVADRLVQVLHNLIGNARSFSPPSGRITVRVRDIGATVELTVEDEGPGIPEANLEHIFDRFYSERPKGENFAHHSGLGLSISRQIVEALHGQISAENRRGSDGKVLGARFIVRLPRA